MRFLKKIKLLIILTLLVSYNIKPSYCNIQNNNSVTKIKSKTIHVKRKSGKIELFDDVIIENDDTSILANKAIVMYVENISKISLKDVTVSGNVKIFNEEFVATGDNGTYDPKDESFTINENVIFNDGTSIAKGNKFIYNLRSKRGFLVADPKKINKLENKRVILIINESVK